MTFEFFSVVSSFMNYVGADWQLWSRCCRTLELTLPYQYLVPRSIPSPSALPSLLSLILCNTFSFPIWEHEVLFPVWFISLNIKPSSSTGYGIYLINKLSSLPRTAYEPEAVVRELYVKYPRRCSKSCYGAGITTTESCSWNNLTCSIYRVDMCNQENSWLQGLSVIPTEDPTLPI